MSHHVILTLGPASRSSLDRLIRTADCFRLNGSHLTPQDLDEWLKALRSQYQRSHKVIPVVVDLQGAKMRIGAYPSLDLIPEVVEFSLSQPSPSPPLPTNPALISIPHRPLFDAVEEGEELSLNDDKIRVVVEKKGDSTFKARVIKNGPLSSHKGINRPGHPIRLTRLGEKDTRLVETAMNYPFTRFAFSFVHTGQEVDLLSPLTDRPLAGKIERLEAMENLAAIDARFNETWLCRGDMGAQAGSLNIGAIQARFARKIPHLKGPAYLAGQVLHHMTSHQEPTRSECAHLHDVVHHGWAGIVLSDETAVGVNPVAVADFIDTWKAAACS